MTRKQIIITTLMVVASLLWGLLWAERDRVIKALGDGMMLGAVVVQCMDAHAGAWTVGIAAIGLVISAWCKIKIKIAQERAADAAEAAADSGRVSIMGVSDND